MKKHPGRPREFDPEAFLKTALTVFWNKGYKATSLGDLMAASGLASASIYRLYPDKKSIFLAALSQYMEEGLARMTKRARALPPEKALYETLDYCALLSTGESGTRGCFTLRAASELLPTDAEVSDKINYMFNGIKERLIDILSQGQRQQVFRSDISAETMAESIFMMLEGMRIYGKVNPDLQRLQASNQFIMQSVMLPQAAGGEKR
ncbi:TetR/AcrR family transcriptional regulator [Mixta gaviniae]|uniref:TetR/AcrR family transcriptional regulator n=1 Tax=Mixta gaviniae TaxID=665914 RepID=A0A1X1D6X3_9GAMM|nr:TetR/AcrR family transcriptional regulator [Mixta gaviniae]AUX92220.1 TetR/AcrR family transcriptional regulator [Mixta gaviniae]ORM72251.1 TetR family transcriptional regulator [Mixta gaviniae]